MPKKILITGGAGFIGSHLTDELLRKGYDVAVLDNLTEQVHGPGKKIPHYLDSRADFILGDVRNRHDVKKALKNVDAVYHFAAAVGVGQSMYEIDNYTDINNKGTAVLLEALVENPVRKLIVASSMSIYGEGLYKTKEGAIIENAERTLAQLKEGKWELENTDGVHLAPIPTKESKRPALSSIYALSKYDQERMSLMIGRAYNMPVVALRFFNVFGTRQALSNPYTGVLAIFGSRFINNKAPMIFEDGRQQRDFVSVYDIARACLLALEKDEADGMAVNIGGGRPYAIKEVAELMSNVLGKENLKAEITGKYRVGDIRHCFADISLAREVLGYEPEEKLEEGIEELALWLVNQESKDGVEAAANELEKRGLTI